MTAHALEAGVSRPLELTSAACVCSTAPKARNVQGTVEAVGSQKEGFPGPRQC